MTRGMVCGEVIGSSPESFKLVLTQDDLGMLQRFYFILTEFEIKLVDLERRVNCPPSSCLDVYDESFKVGLQFSLHSFVVQLLNVYLLSPAQIMPDS